MKKAAHKVFHHKAGNKSIGKHRNHHRVTCNVCGLENFQVDRYKCLICVNYNVCAQCFEKRLQSEQHSTGHTMVHFKVPDELFGRKIKSKDEITIKTMEHLYGKEQHEDIACDSCIIQSISGLRFKCDTCPNFNLCQMCAIKNTTNEKHKPDHPLILVSHEIIQKLNKKDIELGDPLGQGAFGTVYKAKWSSKTGRREVACKVLHIPAGIDSLKLEKSFLRELSAYAEVDGAYILKLFGYSTFQNENSSTSYYLITEYMTKGSLTNLIYNQQQHERVSLRQKLCIACNIATGMRKIHDHSLIHRDLRPDNILVTDNYLTKIGDMGLARVLDEYLDHTQIGCKRYMPPEFYDTGMYDQKLDIFTFGLSISELFTETQHHFKEYRIQIKKSSPIFSDLIDRCLEDDPRYRPTAMEIEATLNLYLNEFDSKNSTSSNYSTLSLDEQNKLFCQFYDEYHSEAVQIIAKQYPPVKRLSMYRLSAEKSHDDKSKTKCKCCIQ
ncbi:unnamed protein product [Rotaria magnacalcarata]|uniref:Uncharacterized protein n=7 Tax=Rotaria magnacalcarata TaxID=392030 RepID=A0A816F7F3_9BILA|nr:unnamed protein product [Rotaria magnacalcarata]CAF2147032.1 unnamed protein product [Rotaria magnacalcarata]